LVQAEGGVLPVSNRLSINLGETPWQYLKDSDPQDAMKPGFDDSKWTPVGVPQSPSDQDTFINLESGGGEGQLTGNMNWYRKHFKLDKSYARRKIFIEFEGAHTGAQVYINGQFVKGNSTVNPNATHVLGFVPFVVDITDSVKFDGSDNVLAVRVARGADFFEAPSFGGAFRFGQSDAGLFRPVRMHITDRVHIPQNVYSVLNTWGTYVATLSASPTEALIKVQTNVLNEQDTPQLVTLTTQIVDDRGVVVSTAQDTRTVAPNVQPGLHPLTFDQNLTVSNPTLWYPNNSTAGKPYMYKVVHTVSIDGVVVDAVTSPLGIRTISWDQNFPLINGVAHYLWGGSGRYDYPALGSAMPAEQKWRDLSLLAEAGGSLYRPGHNSEGPEFLNAADAYGVMVIQPSGDGENGFTKVCDGNVSTECTSISN
jgi:beta-galactosidase/beta-glucuronidase